MGPPHVCGWRAPFGSQPICYFIKVARSPMSKLWGICLKLYWADVGFRSNAQTISNRLSGHSGGALALLTSIWSVICRMYSRCQQISTTPLHRKASSSMLSVSNFVKLQLILIANFSANGIIVSQGRLLPLRFTGLDAYINCGLAREGS